VNNAGLLADGDLLKASSRTISDAMAVNFFGALWIRSLVRGLRAARAQGGGRQDSAAAFPHAASKRQCSCRAGESGIWRRNGDGRRGSRKPQRPRLLRVGETGFEPATPWSRRNLLDTK
jgi:hypothetical protein